MRWKTMGDLLEEDYRKWCGEFAIPLNDPRMVIEFLGAEGVLKFKKIGKRYTKSGRFPEFNEYIQSRMIPMREGFIPPAACVYFPKENKQEYGSDDDE